MPAGKRGKSRDTWILLIGIFKLLKALSLIIAGVGLLKLLHKDVGDTVTRWIEALRIDPENRHIHRVLLKVFNVTPKQLKELSAGTFVYAGLFLTEGIGLLSGKRWAEYFTTISTALLIPLEVYEMYRHPTPVKAAVIVLNVLIVWYLARRLRPGKSQGPRTTR